MGVPLERRRIACSSCKFVYDLGRGKLTTNCFWFGTGHGDPYLSKTLPGATGQRSSILNIYIMYRYGVGVNMFVVCIGTF